MSTGNKQNKSPMDITFYNKDFNLSINTLPLIIEIIKFINKIH